MNNQTSPITRHDDLLIPINDETVAATRYEPTDTSGPQPVLLMHIPYHKDDYVTYGAYDPLVRYLATNGYEVVVSDIIGTGASSGVKSKPFEAAEGPETAAIVDWLAEQTWCNGTVGIFGKSYGGITALKGAAERPEGLGAIVSIHAPYLGFRDYYMGGAFSLYGMGGHWTPLMQALQAKPPGRRDPDGRWANVWNDRLEGQLEVTPWLFQFLEYDTAGEYWTEMDIPVDQIQVPTFAISGWRDGYPHTTMEYFEQIDADKRILLGPWRHTMPHRGRETAINFRKQILDWFDYHLRGLDTDAATAPEIAVWTETDGGGTSDAGVWQTLDEWPWLDNSPADTVSLALSATGTISTDDFTDHDQAVEREYETDQTVGLSSADFGQPLDTNPDDVRSVVFDSDPLATPVELTGSGAATIRFSATTTDPHLAVRVVDVSPDGSAQLVTHGLLKASHRDSHQNPNALTPGETYEVKIPLKAKSHLFETDHRIRIALSGGFFPTMMPATEQSTLTFYSTPDAPSFVEFPGRRYAPGEMLDQDLVFEGPESSLPVDPDTVVTSDEEIEIQREFTADTGSVRTFQSKVVDTPRGELEYTEEITATVDAHAPLSASVARRTDILTHYGAEEVQVVATSRASHHTAQATTAVHVDSEPIFEHTWTWSRQ